MNEPSGSLSPRVEPQFWGSLTDSERVLITAISQADRVCIGTVFSTNNSIYLDRLVTGTASSLGFSEEVYDAFRDASDAVSRRSSAILFRQARPRELPPGAQDRMQLDECRRHRLSYAAHRALGLE